MTLDQERKLVSYDNDEEWVTKHQKFRGRHNEINYVRDWYLAPIEDNFWSIALVDSHPESSRRELAMRLAENAHYIILHDSDPKCDFAYKYTDIYDFFNYRYDYTKKSPYTTVVSNLIDVTKLGEEDDRE